MERRGLYLSASVVCGRGNVREQNQDNYFLNGLCRETPFGADTRCFCRRLEIPALFAVADGIGGEERGDEAALFAVRAVALADPDKGGAALSDALRRANERICQLRRERGGILCGAAFVGLSVRGRQALTANVGDSRAYLFRNRALRQLSRDHTRAQELVDERILSRKEARSHPDRHVLTQSLGTFPDERTLRPHVRGVRIRKGDVFLLCSDGLYDSLDERRIREILSSGVRFEELSRELFRAALDAGGKDNITAQLVRVEG